MRYTTLLPLAAATSAVSAFVIPDEATAHQLVLGTEQPEEGDPSSSSSPWWDNIPSTFDDIRQELDDDSEAAEGVIFGAFDEGLQWISESFEFLKSPSEGVVEAEENEFLPFADSYWELSRQYSSGGGKKHKMIHALANRKSRSHRHQ
ncbi:FAS1 domain-containing protein [Apiospora hydei]|uniref:FAS1 domain-containing protein n=1 Tax=Apiospora hydei TaxID=1337664 RepID=A0ABR1VM60_9PEZI